MALTTAGKWLQDKQTFVKCTNESVDGGERIGTVDSDSPSSTNKMEALFGQEYVYVHSHSVYITGGQIHVAVVQIYTFLHL